MGLDRLQAAIRATMARLTPSTGVRLLHVDGGESVWRVGESPVPAANETKVQFVARELPESLFLSRRLALPRMSAQNTESAILLEVRSHSPFAAEDLAWGFAMHEAGAGRQVDVVMASRKQIEAFLQARSPEHPGNHAQQPEIWALAGLRGPVVLQGYGEAARVRVGVQGRQWNIALLAFALLLTTLVLVTPTAQLTLRTEEATRSFSTLMARAAPLIRKRDELSVLNDRLRALETATADKVDVTAVMEYLTGALPDDTYLYSLDIKTGKIVASGHTTDASALLQRLSSDPRLRDVRSPLAVTRQPGATKEAFTVEFAMAPAGLAADRSPPPLSGPAVSPPSAGTSPFTTGGVSK